MRETVVFLPAMMCDARMWWPQLSRLSASHAMHLPPLTAHETIGELARDVLDGAPARFALAGVGMGGAVALEVARRAPERVTRLALMDTTALAETPAVAAAREPQIARVRAGRLETVMQEEILPRYFAQGPMPDDIAGLVLDMALDLGAEVFIRQSRVMQRRRDQQATLRKLMMPVLVLCGEEDRLYPPRGHELMAELIPEARLEVIDEAGHLPMLERPEVTTQALMRWLDAG